MGGAQLRLPGYGGAAVFLRPRMVAARTLDADRAGWAYDLGLLSPDRFTWFLKLAADDDLGRRLGEYFMRAASEFHPEQSLPAFADQRMGLVIDVRTSTDLRVEVDVKILDGDDDVDDGINFETSRAALTAAADAARALPGNHAAQPDRGR